MKRMIRASVGNEIIFQDENFIFKRTRGVGMNNTPWTGLAVVSIGAAEKHVVEVRLKSMSRDTFDGKPVEFKYYDDGAYVVHGTRMDWDSLDDTIEYIHVLEDAVDFARKVNQWLQENPEGTV